MKPGYVYLMRDSIGRHKIGFSINPDQRIKSVRIEVGDPAVELVHVIKTDDMIKLEKLLHMANHGCHVEGEWFRLDEPTVDEFCQTAEKIFGRPDYEMPKETKTITVLVRPEVKAALERYAQEQRRSVATQGGLLIEMALRELSH